LLLALLTNYWKILRSKRGSCNVGGGRKCDCENELGNCGGREGCLFVLAAPSMVGLVDAMCSIRSIHGGLSRGHFRIVL